MKNILSDYYRVPEPCVTFEPVGERASESGYFRFGDDLILYGRPGPGWVAASAEDNLYDTQYLAGARDQRVTLPFDAAETADNLRRERYHAAMLDRQSRSLGFQVARHLYYLARPLLGVGLRRHVQKAYHHGWEKLRFPHWPVDTTVDTLHRRLLGLTSKAAHEPAVPFIWFWPEGANGCLIMTHDVETAVGRDFCSTLMDLDDEHGIKASFQVVPEQRYAVTERYLESIRQRGHEVNVQDLNHDGFLYEDPAEFRRRARKINGYIGHYGARGFRAGLLSRRQDWFDEFEFSYDMSVPNVAHLDPQRGGCCTVMPYYVGKILELPVTTTQDYQLFYVLGKHSLDLWKHQIDLILENNGLISFIIHPDYVIDPRNREVFTGLLRYLTEVCASRNVWKALPREVDEWWRMRSEMRLVRHGETWCVEGAGSERARVAYARLHGESVEYSFEPPSPAVAPDPSRAAAPQPSPARENAGGRGTIPGTITAWLALWNVEELITLLASALLTVV
ncbi:MAG TPA: hypothetical protein VIY56_08360 [Vicinamibacterales bacterium]